MRSSFLPTLLAGAAVLALAGCNNPAEQSPVDAAPSTVAGADDAGLAPTGNPPDGEGRRGPSGPQTLAEMQARTERNFERRDANGDDVITADELNSDEGGRGGRMLERADADGDGRITREEVRASAAERFRTMDANGDGVVSEDERPQRGDRDGRGPPTN